MKNLFKQEKAITLIALVITIVVLLIISAVIIATLTGDNGLITKAFSANRASREVEIKEKIQLAASAAEIINYGQLRKNEFDIELEKEFGKDNYELLTIGKEFLIIIENIEHRIDINGNISSTSNIESVDISNAGDLSKGGQYDGLTEETAYIVESTLIDLLTYSKFSNTILLANIAAGHYQWDEGIKDVDEINTIYNCPKINIKPGETLLLVSLNNSFNQAKANGVYRRIDIYEATRKFWKISKNSPYEIKYVLGIYKGVVRSVIEVKSWKWATVADDGTIFKSERCIFEGKLLENSPYINKDVSDYPFGSGGAVRYIRK